jgi:hypothetical protein
MEVLNLGMKQVGLVMLLRASMKPLEEVWILLNLEPLPHQRIKHKGLVDLNFLKEVVSVIKLGRSQELLMELQSQQGLLSLLVLINFQVLSELLSCRSLPIRILTNHGAYCVPIERGLLFLLLFSIYSLNCCELDIMNPKKCNAVSI